MKINITNHAQIRLCERVKSHRGYRNWNVYVETAVKEGRAKARMKAFERKWVDRNIRYLSHNQELKMYNGFAFLLARTDEEECSLVTVIKVA